MLTFFCPTGLEKSVSPGSSRDWDFEEVNSQKDPTLAPSVEPKIFGSLFISRGVLFSGKFLGIKPEINQRFCEDGLDSMRARNVNCEGGTRRNLQIS